MMTWGTIRTGAVIAVSGIVLAGCVSSRAGSPSEYFYNFAYAEPKGNLVTVCHGYGCRVKTPFMINETDIQRIREIMGNFGDTPEGERGGVQGAISYIESRVGKESRNRSRPRKNRNMQGSMIRHSRIASTKPQTLPVI